MPLIKKFAKDETGETAIEYGLIATFIAAALVGVLKALFGTTKDLWQSITQGWS